jgi:hypothetical protein
MLFSLQGILIPEIAAHRTPGLGGVFRQDAGQVEGLNVDQQRTPARRS